LKIIVSKKPDALALQSVSKQHQNTEGCSALKHLSDLTVYFVFFLNKIKQRWFCS